MRLKEKVAIVTGASSGIGKAIADSFIKEGAKVTYSDISSPAGFEITHNTLFINCDVSKSDEVKNLVNSTIEKFGRVDVMVNNAGIGSLGGILETDDATWHKTIDVNLSGTFYGMREAANSMKGKKIKGSIINVSSILGKVGFAGAISYCASKGGIVQLTHAGAVDLACYQIRVNAIAPGFIKTNMTKEVLKNEQFKELVTDSTPLGHVGSVEDIANAAVYLASDESSYVTGEILYVDGGWTAK